MQSNYKINTLENKVAWIQKEKEALEASQSVYDQSVEIEMTR